MPIPDGRLSPWTSSSYPVSGSTAILGSGGAAARGAGPSRPPVDAARTRVRRHRPVGHQARRPRRRRSSLRSTACAADSTVVVVGHSAGCAVVWCSGRREGRPGGPCGLRGRVAGCRRRSGGGRLRTPSVVTCPCRSGRTSAMTTSTTSTRRGLADFRARAVPSPASYTTDVLQLTDERRYDVPVTAICPEYSADDLRDWLEAGEDSLAGARADPQRAVRRRAHRPLAAVHPAPGADRRTARRGRLRLGPKRRRSGAGPRVSLRHYVTDRTWRSLT